MAEGWLDRVAKRAARGVASAVVPPPAATEASSLPGEPEDPEVVSRRGALRKGAVGAAAVAAYLLPGWTPASAACRKGLTRCNGRCVNLRTSENNCGRCGHKCRSTQYCSKGKCCKKGLTNCKGTCVNLRTNEQNCGACGHVCASGKFCSKGKCCPVGTRNCGGTCVNIQTSAANCGACGHACAAGEVCQQGVCVTPGDCSIDADCPQGTDSCMTGVCNQGVCALVPVAAGTTCGGTFCGGGATCDGSGACQPGTALNCDDGIACTTDSCNEQLQTCTHTPNDAACDDGNPCTSNVCDPNAGCVSAPVADGTQCLGGGTCQGGACQGGTLTCEPNSTRPCYTGPGGTEGVGVCKGGNQTCSSDGTSWWPCVGQILPSTEVCNGLDDDCDGVVDDGFNVGAACDNGQVGVCHQTGTIVCGPDGNTTCNLSGPPGTPSQEVCNGLDDDCDGTIDNGAVCPQGQACVGGACTPV